MGGEEGIENKKTVKELAFVVPTDVSPEGDVTKLNDKMPQRYHDVMHVLWKKLFDGLGEFIELEVMLDPSQTIKQGKEIVENLSFLLGISDEDLIDCAYFDLMNK